MARFTPNDNPVTDPANEPAVEKAARSGATIDDVTARIGERLGQTARAATVFAEPVERDGITVIPVAKARYGFGGGSGEDGGGGGGGVVVKPVGWIEVTDGASRFRTPTSRSRRIIAVLIGLALLTGALMAPPPPVGRDLLPSRRRRLAIPGRR